MDNSQFDSLREKLSVLEWPAGYLFKFIVPANKVNEIVEILPKGELSTRESGKGKYVSVTSYSEMETCDEVINVYEKASRVQGIMAL